MVIISGYLDRTIPRPSTFVTSIASLDLYKDANRRGFHLHLNPVNWTIVRDFPVRALLNAVQKQRTRCK